MEKWFSRAIINWYDVNKRDLPWRHEKNAYSIWLSEIILQQTQVAQGLSYYLKFKVAYPTVRHLANASEDEVLKLWQGLGYYSRARNLLAAAKMIVDEYDGTFPDNYESIRQLKGIGDYTAAAISSFAFGLPHAVVDGNVYRLLSRVFGIYTPIDSTAGKKEFKQLANKLLNTKQPAQHNQAIMEFGSQYCKPTNPDCENCVLNKNCVAYKLKAVQELPVKEKKVKIRQRYFNYLVITDKKGDILIQRRDKKDIWQGLYEFNLVETSEEISTEKLINTNNFKSLCAGNPVIKHVSGAYKHVLTHQHLNAKFCVVKTQGVFKPTQARTNVNSLNLYAFPRLIEKFLDDCDLKEIL